ELLLIVSREAFPNMAQVEGRIFDGQNAAKLIAVANERAVQSGTAITGNGSRSLVVWQEGRSHTEQHVFAALTDDLGGLGAPIEVSADAFPLSSLAAASDGRDFIIVWRASSGAFLARRVTAEGAVLDATPIVIGDTAAGSYTPIAAT